MGCACLQFAESGLTGYSVFAPQVHIEERGAPQTRVAEVGELDLTASTFRKRSTGRENGDSGRSTKEAVGSLSPVARARGGAGKTTGAKKYPNSPSPIRRRALGELAEDEIREKLQWTHAMSSAKRTIESKR